MDILIIEDEQRAVSQLENMLARCGFNYRLLDVLDSVEDSIAWFQKSMRLDLIFMDIQLADGLSFEIFQKVEVSAPIIFTTAFDQYAIQAFKVNSIDYLLKPIREEDLKKALSKFNKSNSSPPVEHSVLLKLLDNMQKPAIRKGILVRDGSGFVQIKVADIDYCYSEDSITFAVSNNRRFVIEERLDQLYESLNAEDFFKINRGQVVAKIAIQKIQPYFNHRVKLAVISSRDQEFIVSRQRTSEFKKWMNR